jgi:FixJ family two-component response regulator
MKVAIIDDEADMRQSISQWLALSGFDTETYASAEEALRRIGQDFPGIVVSDVRMPGMDGMALLRRLLGADSALPVILVTGHGDVPMAVEAMRIGQRCGARRSKAGRFGASCRMARRSCTS